MNLTTKALPGLLLCAMIFPASAFAQTSRDIVGRVVSTQGAVFAQAPGEERRVLGCRDPIFAGDRVITLDDSGVGIDSGTYHARLGENSLLAMNALVTGAPRLDLSKGHVRLIDSAGRSTDSAELLTPGLRVARTGPNQDALVLSEKAGAVSMVCAYDEAVNVARRADVNDSLTASPGNCVVGKPREALYAAQASHPQLAVLMREACDDLAMVPVADRFNLNDVALGPGLVATTPTGTNQPPGPLPFAPRPTQPCGTCGTPGGPPGGGPGPTPFPFVPLVP